MSSHFHGLREGIVTDPNHVLAEIPLLTDAEKHQLLVEWNDTRIAYPGDKCMFPTLRQLRETGPVLTVG